MTKIVLVEDEALSRLGLSELLGLNPKFEIVGHAEDGFSAVDVVMKTESDVVLIDFQLPGQSGIGAVKSLRQRGLTTPIILVTTFDDDEVFFWAIQVGANGFILKDSTLAELTSCIDKVIAGERIFRPLIARRGRSELAAFKR